MAKNEYVKPQIDIVEVDPTEEDGGARYRLPYGIAKGLGLNTEGMTPRQVWDMLKGKGINPNNAYKELEKKAKTEIKKEEPKVVGAKLSSKEELDSWGKNKGISTNGLFNHLPENVAIEQGNKLVELYEEFPTKRNGEMSFYSSRDDLKENTVAQANYSPSRDALSININSNSFIGEDVSEIEANIQSGWWSKTAPENYKYQTVTHEYGHVIEFSLLSKSGYSEILLERVNKLREEAYLDYRKAARFKQEVAKITAKTRKEMFYDKIFPQIFEKAKQYDSSLVVPTRIADKGYQKAPKVSNYGATSWSEYFAESFASGMLGGDSAIGKATVDVVRKIFKGEIKW